MEYTYRFTTLRGKVQKIERINSAGTLVDPSIVTPFTELPMINFVSDRTVEYYDLYGHKVYRKEYTKNMEAVDFFCGDSSVHYALPSDINDDYSANKYNPEFSARQNSGNITRMTLEYDSNGYVIKKTFRSDDRWGKDKKGTPAQDKKGRWGLAYSVDDTGRITAIHNIDQDGKPIAVQGIYSELIEYGDSPYPVKYSRVDKNNNLVAGPKGFAFDTVVYDEYFNAVKLSCFDADGNRTLHSEYNVSEVTTIHDPESGFVISKSCYDTELEPCICNEGFSRVDFTYNSGGRCIVYAYYDVTGAKTICTGGYSESRLTYNYNGQLVRQNFFDVENNPAVDSAKNVYGYKDIYEDGFIKRIEYLDAEGNLMLNKDGYASMTVDFDREENKVAGFIYKDTEDKRILGASGYAEERYTYEDGNIASMTFYDEAGELVPDSSGVAKYIRKWKDGKLMSEHYFGKDDKPTLNAQGYARADYEYNDSGLKIWERYYDAGDKRIITPAGYSAVSYTYDSGGNKTSMTYYGVDDKPVVKADEYCCYAKEYEYYYDGNIKHIRYVHEENSQYQDMLNRQVKDVYYEYDPHGSETRRYWLNGYGSAADSKGSPSGSVRIDKEYDIYGRMCKRLWYRRGEENAWIVEKFDYDSLGRKVFTYGVRYAGGKKDILAARYEYDAYGRCCKTSYVGEDNTLITPSKVLQNVYLDYSVQKVQHDIYGHETDVWYYDENEEPVHRKDQAFHTVKTYDAKGNVLTESYYDAEDKPAELSEGFHKVVRKYDAFGHEIERWLYGIDGKLIQRADAGCHVVRTYNALGKVASLETYDSEGKPSADFETGAFRIVYAYDSFGNISDKWYYDADGKPCRRMYNGRPREHHLRNSYDFMGKKLSEEVFDVNGEPDSSYGGPHKIENIYNSYGLISEMKYYYIGEAVPRRKVMMYNSEGKKINEQWVSDEEK